MCADRTRDAPLETLFLPFDAGRLAWPAAGALFLRARAGLPLRAPGRERIACEQTFKPAADLLERAGATLVAAGNAQAAAVRYPLVLVLPPRQRDEARTLFARALAATAPGGRIVASASNDEGARSAEADLASIAGPLTTLCKHKCRVFWSEPLHGGVNAALAERWRELDAPRPIASGSFISRPGLFAWDRIDAASALLAAHLPADLAGQAADLGAGFGYLSAELLARCAGITALDVYEAEARALDLARHNLAARAPRVPIAYHWHDVTTGLLASYDVIVCNPPFHTHARADRPEVGRSFIATAGRALNAGGSLWLVANRHLAYESALGAQFGAVRCVVQQQGYKIISAIKAQPAARRQR